MQNTIGSKVKFTSRVQQVNYYIWYPPLTRTLPHFFSQPIGSYRQTLHLNSLWLLIAVRHRNLELSFLLFQFSHHFLSSELQIVDGILFLVAPSPSSTSDSIGNNTLRLIGDINSGLQNEKIW
ncbi:hypothetical protein LWI29_033261 [Acer saccharum]|uniref:Uncharacterized protein n=1 Tax=Acer saccharum TaxID=4024 RepID=A0AA39SSB6_ACESA|nr:hypothetical protein LWI29_033261 [Acer saccharum]